MEWTAIDPKTEYKAVDFEGVEVYLNDNDLTAESIMSAESFCKKHGLGTHLCSEVYYLRGDINKAEYDKTLVGIVEGGQELPKQLHEIIHCLKFWNQEGEKCYQMNGKPGESYQDFILRCIASDCTLYTKPEEGNYITGMGGNHVWVARKADNERILIINF